MLVKHTLRLSAYSITVWVCYDIAGMALHEIGLQKVAGLAAARTTRDADDEIVHAPKSSRLPISVEKPVKISYNRNTVSYCLS